MKIETLKTYFIEQIKDLYHAERRLLDALPRLREQATSTELQQLLDRHANETRDQIDRLEQVFRHVDEKPVERKCRAMVGLLAEAEEVVKECTAPEVRDAAILASVQRIEHYAMAGYGTARTHAELLGEDDAARLLQTTLDEVGRADEMLTELAKQTVNRDAVAV